MDLFDNKKIKYDIAKIDIMVATITEEIINANRKINLLEERCFKLEADLKDLKLDFTNSNVQVAKEIIREGKRKQKAK